MVDILLTFTKEYLSVNISPATIAVLNLQRTPELRVNTYSVRVSTCRFNTAMIAGGMLTDNYSLVNVSYNLLFSPYKSELAHLVFPRILDGKSSLAEVSA